MEITAINKKDSVLFVRVSDEEKAELAAVVAKQPGDVTISQFVRDAFREKIAALKEASAEKPEAAVAPV